MLDMKIVKEGTLVYENGEVTLDGFEATGRYMCREIAILVQLYVGQKLIADALKNLAEPGESISAIGYPDYHPNSSFNPLALYERGDMHGFMAALRKWRESQDPTGAPNDG